MQFLESNNAYLPRKLGIDFILKILLKLSFTCIVCWYKHLEITYRNRKLLKPVAKLLDVRLTCAI